MTCTSRIENSTLRFSTLLIAVKIEQFLLVDPNLELFDDSDRNLRSTL